MQFANHLNQPAPAVSIREQLDATTQALVAAEQAHLQDAGLQWERRGVLQRLVRRPAA